MPGAELIGKKHTDSLSTILTEPNVSYIFPGHSQPHVLGKQSTNHVILCCSPTMTL